MSGAKPWQIALIALGVLGGIAGVVFAIQSSGPPKTANQVVVADVETGELFRVSTKGRTVVIPMRRPDTDARTLYFVEQDGSGWRVSGRYMEALKYYKGEGNAVDRDSGRIRAVGEPGSLPD